MKESLKKVLIYNDKDISKLKIYFDDETNQFKHKHFCIDCKKEMGCYCYNYLALAVHESKNGIYCWQCYKKDKISENIDEYKEEIDRLTGTNVCELYCIIQEIECQGLFEDEPDEYVDKILNYCNDEIDNVVKKLSDAILIEIDVDCDCDLEGSECEI